MTADEHRKLGIASWHAREACLRYAIGDDEMVSYHVMAAREELNHIAPDMAKWCRTPDDFADVCAELRGMAGLAA